MSSDLKLKGFGNVSGARESHCIAPRANWANRVLLTLALGCAGAGCATTQATAPKEEKVIQLEERCVQGSTLSFEMFFGEIMRVAELGRPLSEIAEKTKQYKQERYAPTPGDYHGALTINGTARIYVDIDNSNQAGVGTLDFRQTDAPRSRMVEFELDQFIKVFEKATGKKLARAEILTYYTPPNHSCGEIKENFYPGYQVFVVPADEKGNLLRYKDKEFLAFWVSFDESYVEGRIGLIKEPGAALAIGEINGEAPAPENTLPAEQWIKEKHGQEFLTVYALIDGKRTAEEIMKQTGFSEHKLSAILYSMEKDGIITLGYPWEKESAAEAVGKDAKNK